MGARLLEAWASSFYTYKLSLRLELMRPSNPRLGRFSWILH